MNGVPIFDGLGNVENFLFIYNVFLRLFCYFCMFWNFPLGVY